MMLRSIFVAVRNTFPPPRGDSRISNKHNYQLISSLYSMFPSF